MGITAYNYIMDIASKLKQLRQSAKLTQAQMREILDVSHNCYASWEQGRTEPNVDYLRKLCIIFDVSADELLEIDAKENVERVRQSLVPVDKGGQ